MGRFGSLREFASNARKQKQEANSLDALVKTAALRNEGINVTQKNRFGGLFGQGYDVQVDPNFQGSKQLEREKTGLEMQKLRNEVSFGKPATPMNELQKFTLEQKTQRAQSEAQAQAERDEMLKDSAQDTLNTIGEAKKGIKYFGPMGNVPTILAPSSLFGEYDPRKKWESNVNKLLSEKVLQVMTDMKKASKTGATGFGQLSNKELAVLQEASTALKKDLSPKDAEYYLNEMERIHSKALNGGGQRFGQPSNNNGRQTGKYEIVSVE